MIEERYTVEIPLSDLPPCMMLWSREQIEAFVGEMVRKAACEAWKRSHEAIERWMIYGELPE